MPKYYRFRATTPNRKPKRPKHEGNEKECERSHADNTCLDLTVPCSPSLTWYLRRTSWREPLVGLPRQLAELRITGQLNRPVIVVKIPFYIRM